MAKLFPISNGKNKYHRYSQNFAVSTFARVNNGLRSDIVLLKMSMSYLNTFKSKIASFRRSLKTEIG